MAGKSYARELLRRSTGRDVEELLRELYIEKRYSQEEIAQALGLSRATIAGWLAEYGIRRDDRDPLVLA